MKTNELKKGDLVVLRGTNWLAEMQDNRRGTIRCAKVYGWYTETGDIYTHDIFAKVEPVTLDEFRKLPGWRIMAMKENEEFPTKVLGVIKLTPDQQKLKAEVERLMG